ncbi:biotin--[acetyl-CoA-carboxylase] ligase [Polaribacter sp. P097]|uniref:biotin--[acetyl-CoA-carboxylase] ligase n=1 Tax=Polaribacter sp. P097 TaxID=3117398 RepID=UPI002FE42618
MNLIKLNAIDSTNSFLKEMAKNSSLENYTVVVAKDQTNGRGQQENTWASEPFKNLTFSAFINDLNLELNHYKYFNFAISLGVYDAISKYINRQLFIKWPNDILSANQKICGILIENSISKGAMKYAVVGIGINVNQETFYENLSKASSLKNITGKSYNLDELLVEVVTAIKLRIKQLLDKEYDTLENDYLKVLYKKNIPSMFKTAENALFMGKIIGISNSGNLKVELGDETIKEFGIKEISFA